jgi:hypothetical protein
VLNFIPVTKILCYDCKQVIPVIPPDTSCLNGISLFQKLYGGSKDEGGEWLASSSDSGYVMVGQTNSFGNGAYDGLVVKVNRKGNTVWSRAVGGSGNDYLYGVKRTSDNGFIAVGQTKSYGNPAGDAWLVKLDAGGTVQWSKKYGDGNANGEVAFDVIQLSDGGYAFSGAHRFAAGVTESFVVRTDNQGVVLWSKQYGHSASDEAWGLTEDGNSLVVVGFRNASSFYDGYVMKLDKSTGVLQWIRSYDAENRSTLMAKIRVTASGYQVFSLVADDFTGTNQQQCIWNLTTDGSVQNVRKIVVPGVQTSSSGWHALADGGFVVANGESNNNADVLFTQVNATGTISWSKKYARNGRQVIKAIVSSPEGGYAGTGVNNNAGTTVDSSDVYLVRIDSVGNAGNCSGTSTTDVTIVAPTYTTVLTSVSASGDVTINSPVITPGVLNFIPVTTTLCFYCQPKPTGSRYISAMRSPHTTKVFPNPVIGGVVHLSIDALYDDRAVISIVDLYGNLVAVIGSRDISTGNNLVSINLPRQLQAYSNYYIQVKYSGFTSSVLIFVTNQ